MRPPVDQRSIELLLREIPEFEERYEDLVDLYDEDLTPEVVFMELADFVAELVRTDFGGPELEACFSALELVAVGVDDGPYLVSYAFLLSMPAPALDQARPLFGPRLTRALAEMEAGEPD